MLFFHIAGGVSLTARNCAISAAQKQDNRNNGTEIPLKLNFLSMPSAIVKNFCNEVCYGPTVYVRLFPISAEQYN